MFIENLVIDFYNVIAKQKVLILVNYDIDAICAARILQTILKYDAISYTLIPVSKISDLISSYKEHINNFKYVILINCGGTIDIVENLEPEENVVFFIADSHRPTDVCNIYSLNDQINEDTLDNEENINNESRVAKRRRLDEQSINKRLWEKNRRRILFEYSQFSYYGRSTSILMFELSWQLRRDNFDLLWWGIIGVVEQFILNKIEILQYLNEVEKISTHIGRLCANNDQVIDNSSQNSVTSSQQSSVSNLKINCEKDLQLALYRHWTVENSLRYTMFTAVGLKLWAIKGEKRLHQLLVEMGLPLAESRQQYYSMDLSLRNEFHNMIEKMSDTRNLTHITYPSFTLLQGFRTKYQAADYVYSLLALLSNNTRSKNLRDCFYEAMDALLRVRKDLLDDGIEKSKKLLMVMFKHVQSALDMKQIMTAGPFYYMVIQEGTINAKYCSNPDCLWLLATFALKAYVTTSRKSKAARLPLIASAPLEDGYCIMLGVPPVTETTPRSFFGKAFEQVAEKTGSVIQADYFDSTAVKLQVADRAKIFDALVVLLS
ncbi:hypothetical protein PGB90_001778 [Kerria lacca]